MSTTQNGRPGVSVNSTVPVQSFSQNGMAQHPLASPKTQHITMPPAAPLSPGSHVPQTGPNNAPTPLGIPPRFTGTGKL